MDELKHQVRRAHRRLVLKQLLTALSWSLFAALLLAVLGLAVPKFVPLGVETHIWTWSWIAGSLAVAASGAAAWTYVVRRSLMEAAIEVDRRCDLKERISSSLSIDEQTRQSEIGTALLQDAARRISRIDMRDQFPLQAAWFSALPLAPAMAIFVLAVFVPNAAPRAPANVDAAGLDVKRQIERSAEELKRKLAERRESALEEGLEDAEEMFTELEKGVDDITKIDGLDRKKAMIELKNLEEEIRKRRRELGDLDTLRKQFRQLKDVRTGPADKVAQAMKEGDFDKALDEIRKLAERLDNKELSDADKQALAQQLQEMAEKMQQLASAHEQAKQQIKEALARAKQAGNNTKAGELQNKLDQLNQLNQQMNGLAQMAQKLDRAAQQIQQGKAGEAAQQLDELAGALEEMDAQIDELEVLDDAMEQLAGMKDRMNCLNCGGMGCAACRGFGDDGMPGRGLGEGQGKGARPEAETDKKFYDSQVRGEVRKGKAVITGTASGRNIKGQSLRELRDALNSSPGERGDPLTGVRLPKAQRAHAQQYFDALREGE